MGRARANAKADDGFQAVFGTLRGTGTDEIEREDKPTSTKSSIAARTRATTLEILLEKCKNSVPLNPILQRELAQALTTLAVESPQCISLRARSYRLLFDESAPPVDEEIVVERLQMNLRRYLTDRDYQPALTLHFACRQADFCARDGLARELDSTITKHGPKAIAEDLRESARLRANKENEAEIARLIELSWVSALIEWLGVLERRQTADRSDLWTAVRSAVVSVGGTARS